MKFTSLAESFAAATSAAEGAAVAVPAQESDCLAMAEQHLSSRQQAQHGAHCASLCLSIPRGTLEALEALGRSASFACLLLHPWATLEKEAETLYMKCKDYLKVPLPIEASTRVRIYIYIMLVNR